MEQENAKQGWFSCLLNYGSGSKRRLIESVILSVISVISGIVPYYCLYRVIDMFIPANCLHLLALKTASVVMAGAACYLGMSGEMSFPLMLMSVFFSFSIFGGLESISDSAHVLGVIDTAMDQLDALKAGNYIDRDGKKIPLEQYDIEFCHVDFGYEANSFPMECEDGPDRDERMVLKDVSFTIPERTSTAIVGPSGSGKTTICNLIARFYDVEAGSIKVGGVDVRKFTLRRKRRNTFRR